MEDVPTISESGVSGFKYDAWFGALAPSGTPKPIVDRLNHEVFEILRLPHVFERLAATGSVGLNSSPEEFDRVIADDTEKLARMFKICINWAVEPPVCLSARRPVRPLLLYNPIALG